MQDRLDGWIREFEEFMILKNFSPRTIKTYGQIIRAYVHDYAVHHAPTPLNDDLARNYLLRSYKLGLDWQTFNSDYSAIQKFFKNVILEPWSVVKIPRPRKTKKLPTVLSRQDVVKIIEHAANIKQQTLLLLVYVTGIRLSEVIQLQLTDIDADRMQIRINKSRHFGLHQYSTKKRQAISQSLKYNTSTIHTVFEILRHLLKLEPFVCSECGSLDFDIETLNPDYTYLQTFLQNKAPPAKPHLHDELKTATQVYSYDQNKALLN